MADPIETPAHLSPFERVERLDLAEPADPTGDADVAAAIARLRAAGVLPPAPAAAPAVAADIEARLPPGLNEAERAEVLRHLLAARERR